MTNEIRRNAAIAAMTERAQSRIRRHFTIHDHQAGRVLFDEDESIDEVHFPLGGMAALVIPMRDGALVEMATIGRDGVVGAMAAFGLTTSHIRAVVRLPMRCAHVPVEAMADIADDEPIVRRILLRANEMQLLKSCVAGACHAMHSVEQRFARRLLETVDMNDGPEFGMTQDFAAELLGVRRTSISGAAKRFAKDGIMVYRRGQVGILDHDRLEERACECYVDLRDKCAKIMAEPFGG